MDAAAAAVLARGGCGVLFFARRFSAASSYGSAQPGVPAAVLFYFLPRAAAFARSDRRRLARGCYCVRGQRAQRRVRRRLSRRTHGRNAEEGWWRGW
jgi:hypothetical protein